MNPTIMTLVETGARQLEQAHVAFGHGTTNAFDEAAWLVLWCLGLPLHELDAVAHTAVAPNDVQRVNTLIGRRITSRMPAAYLTREAWLQGVPFYVDERSIVPRSLIAELIACPDYRDALESWLTGDARHVLDLCTGNGSLAALAALAWPEAHIDASDVSAEALAVARINVQRHQLQSRITLFASDGLQNLGTAYDLILCNPPYVNTASMQTLPAEYRAEPAVALAGGNDGMDFIRPLLRHAAQHMTENAVLVLEIGNERDHFEAAFPTLEIFWLPTSAGDDQVLLTTRQALLRTFAA